MQMVWLSMPRGDVYRWGKVLGESPRLALPESRARGADAGAGPGEELILENSSEVLA